MSELVQGTVRDHDATTRAGTVVRDDGVPLDYPGEALDPLLRLLRPGQRVRLLLDGGAVVRVTLLTLPL